jgi:hypothetical protein
MFTLHVHIYFYLGYEMGRLESDLTLQVMAAWQEHEPSPLRLIP